MRSGFEEEYMGKILLTVGVPAYNAEKTLEKCLQSLVDHEKMDMMEILIVDDGSSDRTAEIADHFVCMFPDHIRLIRKKNGGHGSAVNQAIRYARGVYFKNVDSDDWVNSDELEKLLEKIEKEERCEDVICNDYQEVDTETGGIRLRSGRGTGVYGKTYAFETVNIRDYMFTIHSMTIRTSILKRLQEKSIRLQSHTFYVDCEYMLLPVPYVETFCFLPGVIYMYSRGNSEQSVARKNMIIRYDHHTRVVKRLLSYEKLMDMNRGQREYYEYVLRQLIRTQYALALVDDPDICRGYARAGRFDAYLYRARRDMYWWIGRSVAAVTIARLYRYDSDRASGSALLKIKKDLAGKRDV